MNKVVCILISLLIVLLVLPMVVAKSTEINVKTLPYHDVLLVILEPTEQYQLIESINSFSYNEGIAKATHTSEKNEIGIRIIVKSSDQTVFSERFDNYETGKTLYFVLLEDEVSGGYEPFEGINEKDSESEENTTEESNSTALENNNELEGDVEETKEEADSKSVTGQTITENKNKKGLSLSDFPKYIYYIIGAVILVGLIGLLVLKSLISGKPPHIQFLNFKKDKSNVPSFNVSSMEKELLKAERKLREAQVEINRLKNRDKIVVAEKKLEEDRKELEKLKRGEI